MLVVEIIRPYTITGYDHDGPMFNAIFLVILSLFSFDFLLQSGGGGSWPWSYDSWIYNYLWNQCLSPLMLWVRISISAGAQHYVIKFVSDLRVVFSGSSSFPHDISSHVLVLEVFYIFLRLFPWFVELFLECECVWVFFLFFLCIFCFCFFLFE